MVPSPYPEQISFTYKQILDLAGISLDSPNELNDGGLGPPWPIYRITGIEIAVDMVYQNYVETLFPPDPFNFQDTLSAQVYPASKGTFRSPGTKLWYIGNDLSNPESTFMLRQPQGVLLSFTAAGSIGNPSFKAALATLLGAVVLFGAATNLIDVSAAFIIEGFREQKFEDGLDLRIREMLRSQLSDVPTRAEINEYEVKRIKQFEAAEQAAMVEREKMGKLRERDLKRAKGAQGDAPLPEINGAEEGIADAQKDVVDGVYVCFFAVLFQCLLRLVFLSVLLRLCLPAHAGSASGIARIVPSPELQPFPLSGLQPSKTPRSATRRWTSPPRSAQNPRCP